MEDQVGINANHSDMCRFDLSIRSDEDNYEKVHGHFKELYQGALKKQGEILLNAPERELEARLAALNGGIYGNHSS